MSLIKCPECGKQVSDKANQCPECGYNIKTNLLKEKVSKKKEQFKNIILKNKTVCPSCGFEMTETKDICPECGSDIKKDNLVQKKYISPKYLVILAIVILFAIVFIGKDTSLKTYTKYVGENFQTLPDDFTCIDQDDGLSYYSNISATKEKFVSDLEGCIYYVVNDGILERPYGEIVGMMWRANSFIITQNNVDSLYKKLKRSYGKHAYDYDRGGGCKVYQWSDINGLNIQLHAYETDNEYTDLFVLWSTDGVSGVYDSIF